MNRIDFLDRRVLQPQGMRNTRLRMGEFHKDREAGAMFKEGYFADPPLKWEVRYDNGYPNVLYDAQAKRYRCYYTLFLVDPDSEACPLAERPKRNYRPGPERRVGLAYAESRDGVHWNKPSLGITEFAGNCNNNILFRNAHGTGVMLDLQDPDPARRYKLVTKMDFSDGRPGYMAVNFSEDGVHWGEMIPWQDYNPPADSHNFPYYDVQSGVYRVMTRCWRDGVRVVMSCESTDFIRWSKPTEVLRGSGFFRQIYAMPVFLWNALYLGLAAVYHEGDREGPNFDTVDCELYMATKPDRFDAVAEGQNLIPRGEGHYPDGEFDCGCIFASPPIEEGDRLILYYMGGNGCHTNFRETSLGRGWINRDRLAGYIQRETDHPSELCTAKLHMGRAEIRLIADIAEGGWIQAEIRDQWNAPPIPGFVFSDSRLTNCEGRWAIRFQQEFAALKNREVCLALRFSGAVVYAVEGELQMAGHRLWEGATAQTEPKAVLYSKEGLL